MSTLLNNFSTQNSTTYNPNNLDRILHYGRPIVLGLRVWTLISNFYVITMVFVFTRLYRSGCALAFSLLRADNYDWDVDQLRVIYRNIGQALDALLNLRTLQPWVYVRRRTDDTRTILSIVLWKLAAAAAMILTALSPLLISLIPIAPGHLGNSRECVGWATPHYFNVSTQSVAFQMFSRRATLSLATADANYRISNDNLKTHTIGLAPGEDYSISNKCPPYADPKVCDPNNPFYLNATFWITPGEARVGGINTEEMSVGFKNTCYKARLFTTVVSQDDTGNATLGLMYGRDGGNAYSDTVTTYSRLSSTYKWVAEVSPTLPDYYKNIPDYLKTPKGAIDLSWQPNSTINHYGDLVLMFFEGGGVMSLPSKDPLFETGGNETNGLYYSKQVAVPMVCNTSFAVCHSGSCTDVGGAGGFWNYTQDYRGPNIAKGFLETLALDNAYPLLSIVPVVPSSVKAQETVYYGVQSCKECTSAGLELMRLLLSARAWLASAPSRVAHGNSSSDLSNLIVPNGSNPVSGDVGLLFYTSSRQAEMCANTLLDDSGRLVISANLLMGLAILILGLLLILVLGAFLHKNLWIFGGTFDLRWRSYGFLQLHRMLAEETTGQRWKGAVDTFPEGPDIEPRTGAGKVTPLKVVKVSHLDGYDGGESGPGYAHVSGDDIEDGKGRVQAPHQPAQGNEISQDGPGYYTVIRQMTHLGEELGQANLPKRKHFQS